MSDWVERMSRRESTTAESELHRDPDRCFRFEEIAELTLADYWPADVPRPEMTEEQSEAMLWCLYCAARYSLGQATQIDIRRRLAGI